MSQTLLVTGASGGLGRRVLELLLEAGEQHIIATTRTPEKLADFASRGVTVRAADFDQPDSLAAAFAGADRLLLISTDSLDQPGHRLAQHRNAIKAAEAAGVKHVVYTSVASASADSPLGVAPDHYSTEQALEASGMGYTALRNNLYMELLLGSLPRAIASGQLIAAAGDGKAAYVTREDCARAAAAALYADFEGRRALEISGPASVSQAELAVLTQELSGKPVQYVAIPLSALIDGMVQAGLPRPVAEVYASFDAGIAAGVLDTAPGAVELLTGKPAQSVADFLTAHHEALLAQPQA
ncbi:MAG: SDR family oxidoreductase [Anaerolineae bacterium]|jgi:NAD(P)H dehydrogenase (quinone)|nr:SDR family oxidoreductase [Anaerolineae bacterium]